MPASRRQLARLSSQLVRTEEALAALGADLRAQLRYVTARVQHIDEQASVSNYLLSLPSRAADAQVTTQIAPRTGSAKELCYFVTYAAERTLKSHVRGYIEALLSHGIAVVLVVNTPHWAERFELDSSLSSQLSGCLIRENLGFDFAAWAHAYALAPPSVDCDRLFLANDSVVGPLNPAHFDRMLQRVRDSAADFVGLTENSEPCPHIQSYFLAINRRLLSSKTFDALLRGIVNMPSKDAVIEQYETQMARYLTSRHFKCEALFPMTPADQTQTDPTHYHWARLIDAGFPFIKSRVLDQWQHSAELQKRVPEELRVDG